MLTGDDYESLFSLLPHPANGMTFCMGSLASRPDCDLLALLARLKHRVHFVHLRNVELLPDGGLVESGAALFSVKHVLHVPCRTSERRGPTGGGGAAAAEGAGVAAGARGGRGASPAPAPPRPRPGHAGRPRQAGCHTRPHSNRAAARPGRDPRSASSSLPLPGRPDSVMLVGHSANNTKYTLQSTSTLTALLQQELPVC